MIIAAHEAIRHDREPPSPDPSLAHAANFLYMMTGRAPSANAARLMDVDMILHAEHGSNASAFAASVVAGTKANLHAANHRGHRRAVRTVARRGRGERDQDGPGNRRRVAGRRLRQGEAREQGRQ
jgi:hypothetical protein